MFIILFIHNVLNYTKFQDSASNFYEYQHQISHSSKPNTPCSAISIWLKIVFQLIQHHSQITMANVTKTTQRRQLIM